MAENENYTYLRYTGTRPSSMYYRGPGARVLFGQNPTHYQQLLLKVPAEGLKKTYSKELLEIPLSMGRTPLVLHTLINASGIAELTDEVKAKLVAGYETLGEVIADDAAVKKLLGEYQGIQVLNAINAHFGLPLQPEVAAPAAEPAAEPEPKRKVKGEIHA